MKMMPTPLVCGGNLWNNVDPVTVFVEQDFAIGKRKERPIAAGADVFAGDELRAALANQNTASGNKLTTVFLNAKSFANAIAPVADAALTFLVCHKIYLISLILTTVSSWR